MLWRNGESSFAPSRSLTSECVSSNSKMRSAAAIACCRLVLTLLNFFTGVYIMKAAKMNARKLPCVISPPPMRRLPYQINATTATPPRNSISGGRIATVLVTFRLVRYRRSDARLNRCASCASAPNALTIR